MHNLQVVVATVVLVSSGVLSDQLCLVGDFDSQLQHILHNEMLTTSELAHLSRALDDVRNTLRKRWNDFKVFPFGSLVIGLGTKASDADYYVQIPNHNSSADIYVIEETAKLFQKEPTLYSRLRPLTTSRVPVFTFYHIPTHIYCDIVYQSSDGVEYSKVINYFFKLDKRFLPLAVFLKFWSRIHHITGHGLETAFRNYALYSLIIFYLQQKNMAPSVYLLQINFNDHFASDWDMAFKKIPYSSRNTETMYQLLGGFFKYYSEFNFEEYIVSPFAGRPIHKSKFQDADSVPEEFSIYKTNIKEKNMNPLAFNLDEICIQDIFKHNFNSAVRVDHALHSKFMSHLRFATKMFTELPSDQFLRAILKKDKLNETYRKMKNGIDQLSEQKDCINSSLKLLNAFTN